MNDASEEGLGRHNFQNMKRHMVLALDGLLDQQVDVLRQKEDRNLMACEDDRSHLVTALASAHKALYDSNTARKKLEGKYSAMRRNVKLMAEQYEELHSQVGLAQKVNQSSSSPLLSKVSERMTVDPQQMQQQQPSEVRGGPVSPQRSPSKPVAGNGKPIRRILSTKSASATTAAIFDRSKENRKKVERNHMESRSTVQPPPPPDRPQVDENHEREQEQEQEAVPPKSKAQRAEKGPKTTQWQQKNQWERQSPRGKSKEQPHVQTNLTKEARAQLPGHTCAECEAFYAAQKAKGVNSEEIREILNTCSRHRQQWAPKGTPEGFWDMSAMSMPTPKPLRKRPLEEIE